MPKPSTQVVSELLDPTTTVTDNQPGSKFRPQGSFITINPDSSPLNIFVGDRKKGESEKIFDAKIIKGDTAEVGIEHQEDTIVMSREFTVGGERCLAMVIVEKNGQSVLDSELKGQTNIEEATLAFSRNDPPTAYKMHTVVSAPNPATAKRLLHVMANEQGNSISKDYYQPELANTLIEPQGNDYVLMAKPNAGFIISAQNKTFLATGDNDQAHDLAADSEHPQVNPEHNDALVKRLRTGLTSIAEGFDVLGKHIDMLNRSGQVDRAIEEKEGPSWRTKLGPVKGAPGFSSQSVTRQAEQKTTTTTRIRR